MVGSLLLGKGKSLADELKVVLKMAFFLLKMLVLQGSYVFDLFHFFLELNQVFSIDGLHSGQLFFLAAHLNLESAIFVS
jgi:hypothetical protein